jgi:cytochrome P450
MYSDEDPKMDLFLSTNKRWKRMRNIINPTFSPAKLKEVYRILLIKKEIIKKANFFV